ncbi:MAG TPA: DUF2851 family protein [Puia sp.]|nr:DUF2851 family protein [Puia sp.]
MREELLQFIWQFRYFNHARLTTESGQALGILSPGRSNSNQGPDFRHARIRIGDCLAEASVELHLRTSDWNRHAHDADPHYQDTILHVVWENDWPRTDGGAAGPAGIPLLVLQHRVPKLLLDRLERWMRHPVFVPCERQLKQVAAAVRKPWMQELLLERLQQRTARIGAYLEQTHQDWEEATWVWMARSMGQPVNATAFEAIARSLPLRLLTRYRLQRSSMEALLLGQAGLLDGRRVASDALQREYRFLRAKHGLTPCSAPLSFFRMRPGHFPSSRLVQLAGLVGPRWFALLRETASLRALLHELKGPEGLGAGMRNGLLINAFIPLLFAYGWLRDEPGCRAKALRWLREMRPEHNAPLSRWRQLGVAAENAGESQSLLQLKKEYCDTRRCLDCAIGRALLGQ